MLPISYFSTHTKIYFFENRIQKFYKSKIFFFFLTKKKDFVYEVLDLSVEVL